MAQMIEGHWTSDEIIVYREARSAAQQYHKYTTRPFDNGFSAECQCGEIYTAEKRDSVDQQIGTHVENKAEEAGIAAIRTHRKGQKP